MSIKLLGQQFKVKKELKGWTPERDARLKAMRQAEVSPSGMAKVLNISEASIYRRLRVLNLAEETWTPYQDKFLRDNYLAMSTEELAHRLGINIMYIADRLSYLGLTRPKGRPRKR